MASDSGRDLVRAAREAVPEGEPVDFRQRIAAMPRLLDNSDLAEFHRMGIKTGAIRRARRQYVRELLGELEQESARIAGLMARAPEPNIDQIVDFRKATRARIRQVRWLAFLHGLGLQVDAPSRKQSASLTAIVRGAEG